MADLIDHDEFVFSLQKDIIEAVEELGWPLTAKSCWRYNISTTFLKRICTWNPRNTVARESFNLSKLLDAHHWAKEVIANAPGNNRLPY
jgi:hypothetical protein